MILVSMERRAPTLYYGTNNYILGISNFKFTGSGNHPLQEKKKGLRKTRVKHSKYKEMVGTNLFPGFLNRLAFENETSQAHTYIML